MLTTLTRPRIKVRGLLLAVPGRSLLPRASLKRPLT